MPTPNPRTKITIGRGSYANLLASLADLVEGEIVLATDRNAAYVKLGGGLVQITSDDLVTSVNGQVGDVVLAKGDVGLGSADNTSDADKPVSTATQAALDDKADLVNGVVPNSQLPSIAISTYLGVAADEAAMLALNGEKADWCVRTDLSNTWIITGDDSSDIGSWTELATPADLVTSVNGYQGAVVLSAADVGAIPSTDSPNFAPSTLDLQGVTDNGNTTTNGATFRGRLECQDPTATGLKEGFVCDNDDGGSYFQVYTQDANSNNAFSIYNGTDGEARTVASITAAGAAAFKDTVASPSFFGNATGTAQIWYGGATGTSIITADGSATFGSGNISLNADGSGSFSGDVTLGPQTKLKGSSNSIANVLIQYDGGTAGSEVLVTKGDGTMYIGGSDITGLSPNANVTLSADGSATFAGRLKVSNENPNSPNNIWLGLGAHGSPTSKNYDFSTINSSGDVVAGILQDGSATFGEVSGKNIAGTETDGDVEVWIGKTYNDVGTSKIYADGSATFAGKIQAGLGTFAGAGVVSYPGGSVYIQGASNDTSTAFQVVNSSAYSSPVVDILHSGSANFGTNPNSAGAGGGIFLQSDTGDTTSPGVYVYSQSSDNSPVFQGRAGTGSGTAKGMTSEITAGGEAKFNSNLFVGNPAGNGYIRGLSVVPGNGGETGSYVQCFGRDGDDYPSFSVYNGSIAEVVGAINSDGSAEFRGGSSVAYNNVSADEIGIKVGASSTSINYAAIEARNYNSGYVFTGTDASGSVKSSIKADGSTEFGHYILSNRYNESSGLSVNYNGTDYGYVLYDQTTRYASISLNGSAYFKGRIDADQGMDVYTTSSYWLRMGRNGVTNLIGFSNGSLALGGTLDPTFTVAQQPNINLNADTGQGVFVGTVSAQGSVLTSDAKFKTDITDASSQLDDVVALGNSLRNWNWTDKAPIADKETRFLGLIAQEAEEICPGVVAEIGDGEDSYKGIKNDVLVMKLLGAVAELTARVKELESR